MGHEMPATPSSTPPFCTTRCTALDAQRMDWIAVECPPETSEWAGVLDRSGERRGDHAKPRRRSSSRSTSALVSSLTPLASIFLRNRISLRPRETADYRAAAVQAFRGTLPPSSSSSFYRLRRRRGDYG